MRVRGDAPHDGLCPSNDGSPGPVDCDFCERLYSADARGYTRGWSAGYERGQRDERERIVAYLRDVTQHPSEEAGAWRQQAPEFCILITYADHVAALAEAEQRGMMNSHRGRTMYAAGRAEALREAREAIPDNDHRTDLDINDYDTTTEYGLAIAKDAIDALAARQAPEPLTGADLAAEIAAHDNKGFSEERCLRCGWVMGSPALNCNNDDTPHRFPSHSPISHSGEAPEAGVPAAVRAWADATVGPGVGRWVAGADGVARWHHAGSSSGEAPEPLGEVT